MFVDSHCHLDFPQLSQDLDGVLARAENAGITTMLTICTSLGNFAPVRAIAASHPQIWCSAGVHPHEAENEPDAVCDQLVEIAQADPLVIGIGECGLDYYYDNSPRAVQRDVFRQHIRASRKTQLPLIVHTRDADEDTVAIMREEAEEGAYPGVIHCFTASRWLAEQAMELGFYISISGIATFKSAQDIRDTIKHIPLDRLLVETDAPFLAPVPKRGKSNEPSFVPFTAAKVADLKDLKVEDLGQITTANFFTLFSKASPDGHETGLKGAA